MNESILIIEDDDALCALLKEQFVDAKYATFTASSAEQALNIIDHTHIDLIVLDFKLPNTNGLVLAQKLLTQDKNRLIFLISGHAELDHVQQALNMGVTHFFCKPFKLNEFLDQVSQALKYRHLNQEKQRYQKELEEKNLLLQSEIFKRKRTDQALIRLERLNAMGELAAGISHNLNNILTGVVGNAELLRRQTKDPVSCELATTIYESGMRAANLIRRFNDTLKRQESNQLQAIDLNRAIKQVIQDTRPLWKDGPERNGIHIDIHTHLKSIPKTQGTAAGLQDILRNLILNAVKAMPSGGDITISTCVIQQNLQLTISDTGVGMDTETQRRIFEPFFTTQAEVGTGLGLSTVYNTLTQWKGTIEVASTPNKGSTFTITLPTKDTHQKTELPIDISIPSTRLLIIEDEKVVSDVLAAYWSKYHQINVFSNGVDALDNFLPDCYEIAFIDLGLPNMPGNQVAENLRRIDPNLVTILITGWPLQNNDPALSPFDFWIQKPLNLTELESLLLRAIQYYKTRRADTLKQNKSLE